MNSLRDIVELSPQLRVIETQAMYGLQGQDAAQPLAPSRWDWRDVRKVLVIRLRSIGDTVLATPSLYALKRFLPNARVDILVEDWVAPLLDNHPHVDNVIALERGGLITRARVARELRAANYDVVYNLHGGTTATFLTRATGARHRVGFKSYQYGQLHNHQAPSPLLIWQQPKTHSVEQQLALLGWTGVPVTDRPRTSLGISSQAAARVDQLLNDAGLNEQNIALIHPAAAFATKQWATEKFARVVEFLAERGFTSVAIAAPNEQALLETLSSGASVNVVSLALSLPEVTALAARSQLFVGNDSGIAHIAAAVGTPSVVVFGSSNIAHWRPWNSAPAEVVFEEMPCQPCHGYFCEQFAQPECILRVPVVRVTAAIDRLLS
ncbi:MAG TPA: glycosyltransferase family 9 protein [Pyrinomonadaceae bacterium]|jgi:predicted lipopolysaccharide heptosyltransferase III|nr:glycosyltransferase family 9 protein [Pyrinomonadaceae bacterium]